MSELEIAPDRLRELKERLKKVDLVDETLGERSRLMERTVYEALRDTGDLSAEELMVRLR
ncbi:MAG: hypothetical protein GY871_04565 [Actinomycetales bacterium]|nr:hypothetical protein [Actinomycetales bacterium]